MNNRPLPTCDQLRQETLLTLEYTGPGLDAVVALDTYFSRVDDRTKTNNYCALIKRASKKCERFANPKLWLPLHSSTNIDHLIEVLDLRWPTKTEKSFKHIANEFSDIEETFKRKGLRSTNVQGVDPYETKNTHQPPASKQTSNKELGSDFQTAKEQHNPILDDPRLKNIDKNIAERIINEVVDNKQDTKWDDIAGLENVKQAINEIVVYPMQNPELFQGLLSPAKGLLLFGPPGTGKTLIGKCIACESGATFFAISASSLTSKWVGEGEKMVRALFTVARIMQPSVVFIDEIDSLLTHRTDGEHDSTRRIKTEFLVQFDGVATGADDRLLVVGATNRPQELDEAARRRFTKRLYIPLPEDSARSQLIRNLMARAKSGLTDECIEYITKKSAGFSGADIATLCKEAALGSLRAVIRKKGSAKDVANDDIPPICRQDFEAAFKHVKASVGGADLNIYEDWDKKFGASRESIEFDDEVV